MQVNKIDVNFYFANHSIPGHPEEDPDIFVISHLTHVLQPHQLGGIRFMYDNTIESLGEYKKSDGFGCILAHSMGLGKTIQVITFSEIFLRATKAKKVLVIVPINTIQNWYSEYDKWIPKFSDTGDRIRSFEVFLLGDGVKTFDQRVNLIGLFISETLFLKLLFQNNGIKRAV